MMSVTAFSNAAVTLEQQVKIADDGLHFNGKKLTYGTLGSADTSVETFDYFFGRSISAHGDAVKTYKQYVFMTWYKGGKDQRNVMLTRYNTETGTLATIEFPHRHTGFRGDPNIGESHNTIGLAVSPVNGTIHMVYDMHAYTQTNHSGKFKDDYFRYSFSLAGAAEVDDAEFTLDQFVKDTSNVSQGPDDYKHLTMTGNIADKSNFSSLTYPKFFVNTDGTLLLYMRLGGNNNGAYVFNRYDATTETWSKFTKFNLNNQKAQGNEYNWGLYGNMKYVNGKLQVGFQQRSSDNNDKYQYQNGVYYAYSDHPEGFGDWKNHKGEPMTWPLVNSDEIKIFEPGDLVETTAKNQVYIVGGFDWTVTEKGDVHFVHQVKDNENNVTVRAHTYKPVGAEEFITTTDFTGASNIYTAGDNIYIIGMQNGRPFVEKAAGGTNDFVRVYEDTDGMQFDHGVVYIKDGKAYYYLMGKEGTTAKPLYLQIIDLDIEADLNKPQVVFPQASMSVNEGYDKLAITLDASSPVAGRTIQDVALYINGELVRVDNSDPYLFGHGSKPHETGAMGWLDTHEPNPNPLGVGTHLFKAIVTDSEGETGEALMRLEVKSTAPVVSFGQQNKTVDEGFEQLGITVNAEPSVEGRTIESVTLYINGEEVRKDTSSPYNWGHKFKPHETGAMGWISCEQDPVPNPCHEPNPNPLGVGEHTFTAVAVDSAGQSSSATMTLNVASLAPTVSFPYAEKTLEEGYEKLAVTIDAQPAADDRTIESVTLYINDELVRVDTSLPYLFGHGSKPHETGAMGWLDTHAANPAPFTEGEYIFKAVALDSKGAQSEATMILTVVAPPEPPVVSFPNDVVNVYEGFEKLNFSVQAETPEQDRIIESVTLYINGELIRVDTKPSWNFGHQYNPHETGAMGWGDKVLTKNPNPLGVGEHIFEAVAKDSGGLESTATMTLVVNELPGPSVDFAESDVSLIEGYQQLSLSVNVEAAASYVDVYSVALYLNGELIREIYQGPYTWGAGDYANELLSIPVGYNTLTSVATDSWGNQSETSIDVEIKELVLPEASFEQDKLITNVGYQNLALTVDATNAASYISISQVDLYINDELISSDFAAPYEWGTDNSDDPYELTGLPLGVHTVKAVAIDTQGSQVAAEMVIDVKPALVSVESESEHSPAINLFDGDYSDESSWSSDKNGTKSLVIDLGDTKTIIGAQLWTTGGESVKYHIFVANSLDEDFVKAGSHMPKRGSSQPFTANFVAEGRFVKLMVLGNWPSINEFEVITE
ncbi:hypothetical protein C2869_06915 [Saccharobesus litoralis]|uniref:F5/8 type C domain-containing protein n=2 Tax=Saccharobesus litoralis TaxID=2172099 RepID=A0A2S0VXV2_9ALTE|nr:hypothetical protein C2869_06915 [Saccharobesus litoralis]